MVTFVATTDNFKELAKNQAEDIKTFQDETALFDQRYQEKSSQTDQERNVLLATIQDLKIQLSTLALAKRKIQTDKDDIEIRYKTISGILTGLESTIAIAHTTRDLIQDKLTKALADRTKLLAQLSTSEANQSEKIVYIDKLNANVKHLIEQKAINEAKIAALSRGNPITSDEYPVTIVKDFAVEAPPAPTDVALKGVVKEVSGKDVVISIGSADGVSKKTVFHITRGDLFICDIKISSVDTNKSAGVVELLLQDTEQPKIGDTVSNEL